MWYKMRIQAINQNYYGNVQKRKSFDRINTNKTINNATQQTVSFKGDRGALIGMLGGALVGVGAAAFVVATGGLGAAVTAVGLSGVGACGAGVGAHVGGIAGGLIEDKLDENDKNNKNKPE